MSGKTRILIVTDSPVLPSGLAETTRLLFEALLDRYPEVYELHQVALFHCYAVTTPRWPVYPTEAGRTADGQVCFAPDDRYGQKTFPKIAERLRPDLVFGFGEPHRLLHLCRPRSQRPWRLVLYVNFDGLPVPPGFAPGLAQADLLVTKSEFARQVLLHSVPGVVAEKCHFLYSPADTRRFAPPTESERSELRRELFPPWVPGDAFVLGWIGRNQWRKQVWLLYKVIHYLRTGQYLVCRGCGQITLLDWDPLRRCVADPALLAHETPPDYVAGSCRHCRSREVEAATPLRDVFLWTHMPEEPGEDWPARWLEAQFDVQRDRDVYYTPGHGLKAALAPDDIPTLYRLWDCMLFLSGGEGFGLPAWEAMCAGLPVIYTQYSSHAEFLGRAEAGLPVSGVLQPESKTGIWRMVADVGQAIAAVRRLYFDAALRRYLGENGRRFVSQFTPELQTERWHRLLGEVLQR